MMKFDSILEEIGEFGSYQRIKFLLLCLPPIISGMHAMIPVFITSIPDHRCTIPGYTDDTYATQGYNHTQAILANIPSLYNNETCKTEYSKCTTYNGSMTSNNSECSEWVFDKTVYQSTVMTEFNLVCGKETFRILAQTVFMAGILLGSIIFGSLSDWLGRKKVMVLCILFYTVSAIAVAFARDITSFIILRMILGASLLGEFMAAFVISLEIVGPSKRIWTGNLMNYPWGIGIMGISGIAYFIRDWVTLQLVISAPLVIFLSYWWLIPESPRWLMAKGRYKEAHAILEDMARWNKRVMPVLNLEETEKSEQNGQVQQVKPWQMFSSRVTLVRCLILFWNWIVIVMVYYGLSLNSGNLAGNPYTNLFLSGLIEFPAYILCMFLWDRIGRKPVQVGSMIIGGLACMATVGPVLVGSSEPCEDSGLETVTMVLSLIGKFGATVALTTIFIYSAELYPTVVRNASLGMSSMFARVGGMISPLVADLGMFVPGNEGKMLPLLVFGVCSVTAGIAALWLPETLNQRLPDTIEEAKNFGRVRKNKFKIGFVTIGKEVDSKPDTFAYLNPAFKETEVKTI